MQIKFDQQDLINSVCIFIAADRTGQVHGSRPDLVFDINFHFNGHGVTATANYNSGYRVYSYNLSEQDVIDAVTTYLSAPEYHSFLAENLDINLGFIKENPVGQQFVADISVRR
jgi:hypothetical protein